MRVFGIVGWSGSGKTRLIRHLIPVLTARGRSVSTIKHAHHDVDLDHPGKDSFEHREAGAREVILATAHRFALMRELRGGPEPSLAMLVERLDPVDIVLVEGFKRTAVPKIEVHRPALGAPLLWPEDPSVVAVASDAPLDGCDRPVIDLRDIERIADLVEASGSPMDSLVARCP